MWVLQPWRVRVGADRGTSGGGSEALTESHSMLSCNRPLLEWVLELGSPSLGYPRKRGSSANEGDSARQGSRLGGDRAGHVGAFPGGRRLAQIAVAAGGGDANVKGASKDLPTNGGDSDQSQGWSWQGGTHSQLENIIQRVADLQIRPSLETPSPSREVPTRCLERTPPMQGGGQVRCQYKP